MSDLDSLKASLKDLLCRNSVRLGEFTLASGEKSNVYVDCRLTTFDPEAMPLIGRLLIARIAEMGWNPDAVGGLTLGADPVAYAIARESLDTPGRAKPIRAFTIRKEAKQHGRGRQVEGMEQVEGLNVVILDDVCTSGGSTAQAIEKAKEAGMNVLGAVCIVDRQQGGAALLKERFGLELSGLYTLKELIERKNQG